MTVQPEEPVSLRAKTRFVAEVFRTYTWVRWLLLRYGLQGALKTIRRGRDGQLPDDLGEAAMASAAVGYSRFVAQVLRRLPTDRGRVIESLVLTAVLARRGLHSRLALGVGIEPSLTPLAWVEVGESSFGLPEAEDRRMTLLEL